MSSPKSPDHCRGSTGSKAAYGNRAAAATEARRLMVEKPNGFWMRPYPCEFHGWHVGHGDMVHVDKFREEVELLELGERAYDAWCRENRTLNHGKGTIIKRFREVYRRFNMPILTGWETVPPVEWRLSTGSTRTIAASSVDSGIAVAFRIRSI